ncbi:hypothetical protein VNI00_015600 [Paramarasmius palmivorus]|uniref:Polyketide synthase n=1 Tax=Paramarasmius palmivorus TaxID=297713 RepID=A0AAW0BK29_9AGAR
MEAENFIFFNDRESMSWSTVFMGIDITLVKNALNSFASSQDPNGGQLFITAVTDLNCATVSGRPDILRNFSNYVVSLYGQAVTTYETGIRTLYHSPVHTSLRQQILDDVVRRSITLPNYGDIIRPFRSSFSGLSLSPSTPSNPGSPESLLHAVVDMIVLQPVHWDAVALNLSNSATDSAGIRILNFGPGAGLASSLKQMVQHSCGRNIEVVDISKTKDRERAMSQPKQEPIAIVGMAVNLPGAPNVSMLWEVLEKGINTVKEIPEQRFKVSDYDGRNPKRQMKAHTGNFIDGAGEFDNAFFKISPREAKSMDPQQRILLQTAYEALEDSGYVPNISPSFAPETFGCYVGATAHDYVHNLRNDIDVYYSTGTLNAFLCGRISYVMQLSGPSMVVDTACSSSSVAFYQACRALANRDCNAALAGGINIISSPDLFLGLDRAHFLSPTGQCQAFDASADGYSRSEGCGMFVLKRLSDAVAEHDNILGVIRGIEVNQSGRASSITHPHSDTQSQLFKTLLEKSGVTDPLRVSVVEAHGTGTQAGDPNELESIRSVLCTNRPANNPLHVTSIKANIGHVETASGAAGLAKLLLMFQHETIPRQISLQNLNPRIAPLESDNTIIARTQVPWRPSPPGMTRLALLNNFGAAGSNVAMLVEEHLSLCDSVASQEFPLVFGLSAKDQNAAQALRDKYIEWLQSSGRERKPADVAYTMTGRRQLYPYRLAVCASSTAELAGKLQHASIADSTWEWADLFMRPRIVFRSAVDECHHILLALGFPGVLPIILAHGVGGTMEPSEEQDAYQASVFTLQYALGKMWMSWGVNPSAVIGHSLGEYAALYFAAVLTLRGALALVAHRARLMFEKCRLDATGMLAINQPPQRLQAILTSRFSELTIACFNSPADCVVAGSADQLSLLKAYLDKEIGCKSTVISVPFGYHSKAMLPILPSLSAIASSVDIAAPTIPIVSNVHGTVVSPGDATVFDADYFGRHCVEPVRFDSGVNMLVENCEVNGNDIWIEIGPHPTTLPMIKSNPIVPKEATSIPSLRKKQDPWLTLMTSLSLLYTRSIDLRWHSTFDHIERISCTSLPSYPFSKQKFWVPFVEEHSTSSNMTERALELFPPNGSPSVSYTLVESIIQHPSKSNGHEAIFETPVEILAPWIAGHKVGGTALCPASVFMEIALCAVQLSREHLLNLPRSDPGHTLLRNVEFVKPLTLSMSAGSTLRISITQDGDYGTFTITSNAQSFEDTVHAKGDYRVQTCARTSLKLESFMPHFLERISHLTSNPKTETLYTRVAYNIVFPRVVDYGHEYHGIERVSSVLDGDEGYAHVKLPAITRSGAFLAHPVLIDCLLHVSGFIVNMQADENQGYICHAVGSLKMLPSLIQTDSRHIVYCRTTWSSNKGQAYSEVWAQQDYEPRRIVLHAKDVTFKRVRLDVLKRSLALSTSKGPISVQYSQPLSTIRPPNKQGVERTTTGNVESRVLGILSEACGMEVSAINSTSSLDSLGVDSLMSIELLERLKAAFPSIPLDHDFLSHCNNTADLISALSAIDVEGSCTLVTPPAEDSPTLPPTPQSISSELPVEQDLAGHFDSLGLDSLASIEVLHELKTKHNLNLPDDVFHQYPTLRSLKDYLAQKFSQPVAAQDNLAIEKIFQLGTNPRIYQNVSTSDRAPIFLIHDGSGLANYYERLQSLTRSLWAIHNPRFLLSEPWKNLAEIAKVYADFIISTVGSGPVIIGGWSFGAVAAYETAVQIRSRLGNASKLTVKGPPSHRSSESY